MFIGREKELYELNRLYNSGRFEFAVIYGRRRVGKTALINEFIRGKKSIYFMGIESNEKQNLENFSKSILETTGQISELTFSSFQAALEAVFRLGEKERLILAIDEYPYIARSSVSLASTLQLLIDKYGASSHLMLILCGSSMSYMEDHVLAYKAPLFGRRTAQLRLLPFSFAETIRCFDNYSDEDKALLYGAYGGTPQYLLQVDTQRSVEENIKNTYLNPASALFEEPVNLLKQEMREPAIYNAIVTAIASGASRISEITGKIGEDTGTVSVYIKNLISLGIVQRELPFGETIGKKSIYSISDHMFRFWYRFVPGNTSLIMRGAADLVYNRIAPDFPDYMGKIFETICTEYLWVLLLRGKSPVLFSSLGRWWGTDPVKRIQSELDIMGEQDADTALFGECKWTNEKVDSGVLETLIERSCLFRHKTKYLYLFAKTGFTAGCVAKANELKNVALVTYADIISELQQ